MSLFHAVRGQGQPLVLLHGWAMHAGIFGPLLDTLADDFELHLVDLPGHGRSAGAPRCPAAPGLLALVLGSRCR